MKCHQILQIVLVSCFLFTTYAQQRVDRKNQENPPRLDRSVTHDPNFTDFSKKSFYQQKNNWQTIIDSTWGSGLPTADKLQIFDLYWNAVDDNYAGFVNLDVDWDSLYSFYRPEVEAGVSRGRFAAIMNQLAMALMEIHTHCNDAGVREDSLHPGVPLLAYHSAYKAFDNGHFGAGLTPLPDSSALVYKVVDNHPLGLERGDIILGYNGVPWKYLYQEFLAAELPITIPGYYSVGTSERSVSHMWLMSAGLNWHLFDTIDILKYSTNDTVHLSTSHLIGQDMHVFCSEQLPIQGVPMIDISRFGEIPMVSWGIVDNTQIGYIYVTRWRDLEELPFTNAVNRILNDYQTTGLILDFRSNPGGQAQRANGGLSRLFNFDLNVIEFAERSDPNDHFTMTPVPSGYCTGQNFRFHADSYLYDKPIAVLTGSITISHAEVNALRLKYHPMARFFGKPINTGLTCYDVTFQNVDIPFVGWQAGYAPTNVFLSNDPSNYLMHVGFEVDEEVWLTQNDVANGEDTVVKAAMFWINSMIHAYNVKPHSSFIRPSIDTLTITANVANPNTHNLNVAVIIKTIDSVFVDSLPMFDDGSHGDSLADDGLYGCYLNPLSSEDVFTISASVTDLDSSHYHILPNATRFTTIGPIYFETYSITGDTIIDPGDNKKFQFSLHNSGANATATNVTSQVVCLDTFASISNLVISEYGDIAAGAIVSGNPKQYIRFSNSCTAGLQLNFALEIFSDGYKFWSDTFSVFINPSGLERSDETLPLKFALKQNYPNPFNPTTNIQFSIPKKEFVTLKIFNLLGQEVTQLVAKRLTPGNYKYTWDATAFASGVYLYRLETDQKIINTKKLILLK